MTEQAALRVLLIEDNPDDVIAVRRMLSRATTPVVVTEVADFDAAIAALDDDFDACLLDYELGTHTAIDLLKEKRVDTLAGPIILLTGHDSLAVDDAALQHGAADFLAKSKMTSAGLDRAIRYSCRQFSDQRKLRFMARHDQLTGLLNRHTFIEELSEAIPNTTGDTQWHVLYVDLDGFKAINDAWGHDIGDRALQHAAKCLQAALPSELVGRYGGDELIAALPLPSAEAADSVLEGVLAALREPLPLDQERIVVTASIGVARATGAQTSANELVRLADYAMFAAKQSGRDTWAFFSEHTPQPLRERAALEGELRQALMQGDLHLEFESHCDLRTNRLVGAEALTRWHHPERGEIAPSVFVPLVTQGGLLRPFGQWVIEAALDALVAWRADLPDAFRLGVNVPPAQLLEPGFVGHLTEALRQRQLPARWLRLEITEDALLAERGSTLVRVRELRELGVSLALDDFGTGHSSLAQIAQLPIDTLKIDTTFVGNMRRDERAAALVRAILSLGEELSMTVIAEGVENAEIEAMLEAAGARLMQGFRYPRGDVDVLAAALAKQHASQ